MKMRKASAILAWMLPLSLMVAGVPARADGPRLGAEVFSVVVVSQVAPGSAAARAGLRANDIILEMNGQPTSDATIFGKRIQSAPDGPVQLKVLRDNETLTLTVNLGNATAAPAARSQSTGGEALHKEATADKSHKAPGPSSPPAGKYDCWNEFYTPMYSGSFVLSKGNTYQYLTGSKSKGTYKYDSKTKKIKWLSGVLAKESTGAEYEPNGKDGPDIILHFPDVMGQKSSQVCFWRGAVK
jgi:hypothetical protein